MGAVATPRFRPPPAITATGGVRPPSGVTPGQNPDLAVPPEDGDNHLGAAPPEGVLGVVDNPPRPTGGREPRDPLARGGSGGSSNWTPLEEALRGNPEVQAALDRLIQEKVGTWRLSPSPPAREQALRRSGRGGSRSATTRPDDSESRTSTEESTEEDTPPPSPRRAGRDDDTTAGSTDDDDDDDNVDDDDDDQDDGADKAKTKTKAKAKDKAKDKDKDKAKTKGKGKAKRVIPRKIKVNNPLYKEVFDCETYALADKSTRYTRQQARTLGRRKKDVIQSFGPRSEWDGTPPLKVFQFLRKFSKACDDNDVTEGEAFYMLPEFTKEPLRSDVMGVMPSRHGGNPGEVSSYMELVNYLIRLHADEATLASQVEEFNRATQNEGEDECAFAERLRQLNVLCGFIHSQGVIKGRFVEGVHRAARATARERNTPTMSLAELARLAKTKGDEYRWMINEQRKERQEESKKAADESRLRRLARLSQTTQAPPKYRATQTREDKREKVVAMTIPAKKTVSLMKDRPCWQCGATGHWATTCPKVDPRLRAQLAAALAAGSSKITRDGPVSPARAIALAQAEFEEDGLELKEGEDQTPAPEAEVAPSSESEEGNA